jgi:hypothetical protein
MRSSADVSEETFLLRGIPAELVAEHTERTGRVAEPTGDVGRGESLDEVGAESLVLALEGLFRFEEEASFGRYSISVTGAHIGIMLDSTPEGNPLRWVDL